MSSICGKCAFLIRGSDGDESSCVRAPWTFEACQRGKWDQGPPPSCYTAKRDDVSGIAAPKSGEVSEVEIITRSGHRVIVEESYGKRMFLAVIDGKEFVVWDPDSVPIEVLDACLYHERGILISEWDKKVRESLARSQAILDEINAKVKE